MIESAAQLNVDCQSARVDRVALELMLRAQGEHFSQHVTEHCPHLFAANPFFVSAAQVEQMRAVVSAVERVVALPGWQECVLSSPALRKSVMRGDTATHAKGVFFGYDFHLNATGAHLIEINTNAGGAFLNNLLLQSQREQIIPGLAAAEDNLEQVFLDMFRNEWRLERGDMPLLVVAIVDESPPQQFLYPEFLLAQGMFERAGIAALIEDPAELELREGGLYCGHQKIDLVYNRLTDFSLQRYAVLNAVVQHNELAVITPHPLAYDLYADKYNLTLFSNAESLRVMGVAEADIAVLQAGIPQTMKVLVEDEGLWWAQRKQWFFKPARGYGSKGTYRGANLTQRVFAEILQGNYVAQRLAVPGERAVCGDGTEPITLKADVRCYVYDGKIQLIAARLYQGQTTNFRTLNGGFAQVRIVDF